MRSETIPENPAIERIYPDVDYLEIPKELDSTLNGFADLTQAFTDTGSPSRVPTLTISDHAIAWSHLKLIESLIPTISSQTSEPKTPEFIEWGSGLGAVSLLASHLGWNATGIDIEPNLVKAANEHARKYDFDVQFHIASYKPEGFDDNSIADVQLSTEHGFGLFDFDIIYGYFWPAECDSTRNFFFRHAEPATLFMLYKGGTQFEMYRCNA